MTSEGLHKRTLHSVLDRNALLLMLEGRVRRLRRRVAPLEGSRGRAAPFSP